MKDVNTKAAIVQRGTQVHSQSHTHATSNSTCVHELTKVAVTLSETILRRYSDGILETVSSSHLNAPESPPHTTEGGNHTKCSYKRTLQLHKDKDRT